jgi:hypothetical protein
MSRFTSIKQLLNALISNPTVIAVRGLRMKCVKSRMIGQTQGDFVDLV